MVEIKVPYTTNPHMQKASGPLFTVSPRLGYNKVCEMIMWGTDLYGSLEGGGDLVLKASELCKVNRTSNIASFALNFEEDVAILHKGILTAICFCFPSSWVPRERLGMSLASIHEAVADGEKLVNASSRIAEAMCRQPFERSVWTITNSASLSQHPKSKPQSVPKTISDLYFRTERQTSIPLDQDSSLFFVRVDVKPLDLVFSDLEVRQRIVDSINSMSDNILHYKNLVTIKVILNNYMVT